MNNVAMIIDYERKESTKEKGKFNNFISLLIGNTVIKLFANEEQYKVAEIIGKRNDANVDLAFYECARDNFGNPMFKFTLDKIEKIK